MRLPSPVVTAVVVTALASWSCRGDATGPEDDACEVNTTTVYVSSGVMFDWSPGCAVAVLRVQDEAGGDMWVVYSPEIEVGTTQRSNRIIPRVTYGIVPAGTGSPRTPVPLATGGNYRLTLWRAYADGRLPGSCPPNVENLCRVALQPFVRP